MFSFHLCFIIHCLVDYCYDTGISTNNNNNNNINDNDDDNNNNNNNNNNNSNNNDCNDNNNNNGDNNNRDLFDSSIFTMALRPIEKTMKTKVVIKNE